jgi:hypothetical protein
LGSTAKATIRIEEPNMRTHPFDPILLAIPALALMNGAANALTPTLEVQAGPFASMPTTNGSISLEGLTVNGVPVVGSIEAPELQVNGDVTLAAFIPFNVDSTEYNVGLGSGKASFSASISGTLAPQTSLDWSVYYDPMNTPDGMAMLVASNSLFNPTSSFTLGFLAPLVSISGPVDGPFSLTEVLTISGPSGAEVRFNSSVSATVPEASTWAMMLMGFAGCGLIFRQARRREIGGV